jgi:F-type H+-transporting ATPase subunit epsilon
MSVLSWSIVTPDGPAAGGECEFIVLPTERGELGVMPGHAALVARVVPGALRVTSAGSTGSWRVGEGLVEVRDDTVRILLPAAPPVFGPDHQTVVR